MQGGRTIDPGTAWGSNGEECYDPIPHLLRAQVMSCHLMLSDLVGGNGAKSRAMIVTGWNQARADPVVWELLPRGFDLKWHSVKAEPSLSDVAKGE